MVIALPLLLFALLALAMIAGSKPLSEALLNIIKGVVGGVPLVGHLIGKGLEWVAQKINNAFSKALNGTEATVGGWFHAIGNLATSIGNEIEGLSNALVTLDNYINGVIRPWVIH